MFRSISAHLWYCLFWTPKIKIIVFKYKLCQRKGKFSISTINFLSISKSLHGGQTSPPTIFKMALKIIAALGHAFESRAVPFYFLQHENILRSNLNFTTFYLTDF